MAPSVILLNDRKIYNKRYRGYLEKYLDLHLSGQFVSFGLLDTYYSPLLFMIHQLKGGVTISSNLKSNLFTLLTGAKGPLILNGLGRYEKSRIFRYIFLCLARLRKKKVFFVQRYRDYLWLKRHIPGILINWMPGSGTEPLSITNKKTPGTFVVISRPEKLKVIETQLLSAARKIGIKKLLIYGVDSGYDFIDKPNFNVSFMGYVTPSEFFLKCNNFLQVGGYGEGFPHTLAYALSSGVTVIIDKKLSRSLGMYKLPVNRTPIAEGLESLEGKPELIKILSAESVYRGVIDEVEKMAKSK